MAFRFESARANSLVSLPFRKSAAIRDGFLGTNNGEAGRPPALDGRPALEFQ